MNDPLAVAAGLLPAWTRWVCLIVVPMAFLAGLVAGAVVAWLGRALPAAPWTERARVSYPTRSALAITAVLAGATCGPFALVFRSRLSSWPAWAFVAATALAGFLGADVARLVTERRVHREHISAWSWYAAKPFTLFVRFPHVIVAGAFAVSMPARPGLADAPLMALCVLLILAAGTGVCWLPLVAIGLAKRAPPRLAAIVARASKRTAVTPRGVMLLPSLGSPVANAYALPILRRLAFTEEALLVLDDDEIEAIAAHELGHVSEPRLVAWSRALGTLLVAPLAFARPVTRLVSDNGVKGVLGFLLGLVAFFAALRLLVRMARRMEERADRIAGGDAHDVSEIYARALEKIYRRNLVPAVLGKGKSGARVHPDLYDRLIASGVVPEYPRPAPPNVAGALRRGVVVVAASGALLALVGPWVRATLEERVVSELGDRAMAAADAGEYPEAIDLFEAAESLAPHDPKLRLQRAALLSRLDECDDAARELETAQRYRAEDELDEWFSAAHTSVFDCFRRKGFYFLGDPQSLAPTTDDVR